MDDHEAAAADIGAAGVGDRLGIAGGHRGVDGVAAGPQDLRPGVGGEMLRRHHHAVRRLDRGRGGGLDGDRPQGASRQRQRCHCMPDHLPLLSSLGRAGFGRWL
jgi:hypothetical protein